MKIPVSYINIILLVLLSVAIAFNIYLNIEATEVYIFSAIDLLNISTFIFALRLVLYGSVKGQYILLVALLLGISNVINIQYTINEVTYSSKSLAQFGIFNFNPGAFLLLIFFFAINRESLLYSIKKILYGSYSERVDKRDKVIFFYYNKFNSCELDELLSIFKNYSEYPEEAQIALRRIYKEKNLTFIFN